MASKVVLLSHAQEDLLALSGATRGRIIGVLRELSEFPLIRSGIKKLKPPFKGYRKRAGTHRILFDYDSSAHVVYVRGIKDRKDAYR